MMLQNLVEAFGKLAPDVEDAIRDQLIKDQLSKSGELLHSVQCTIVQGNDGYQLETYMLFYWQFLDDKYNFMAHAVDPMSSDVLEALTEAAHIDITNHINQIFER